jgi:hypothetical protein
LPDTADYLLNIKTESTSLVAALRANSSIPYYHPYFVETFNSMTGNLMSSFQGQVSKCLRDAGVGCDIASKVTEALDVTLDSYRKPLDFLSSVYKQDGFFKNHPLAVMPERIDLAPRLESHSGISSVVYDSFQYVPVRKTLSSLLQNGAYVEALLKDKCEPGFIADFADGIRCK